MIIRTAAISAVVGDAAEALKAITAAVEARGGYLAESRRWREGEQLRASATIRVPEQHLNSVLVVIRAAAIRVENESVSGQDVSEEYVDLTARLTNLEATERELRELLSTIRVRTQKASEVMEVYREITDIRGQIEQIKGRMRYLEQMTTLSTINLELIPDVLAKPIVEPGWQPLAVLKNASRALVESLKFVAEAIIWFFVYLLPIGLLFVAFALLIRWVWLRRRPAPIK